MIIFVEGYCDRIDDVRFGSDEFDFKFCSDLKCFECFLSVEWFDVGEVGFIIMVD